MKRHAFHCSARHLETIAIASLARQPNRQPMAFDEQTSLHSSFGSIGGIGSSLLLAQRSLGHGAIHRLPFPLNPLVFVIAEQTLYPQLPKDAGLGPLLQAAMSTPTLTAP